MAQKKGPFKSPIINFLKQLTLKQSADKHPYRIASKYA